MMSSRKGSDRERELVNTLAAFGYIVLRIPASGSATDRDLPDVIAGKDGVFYAFEVKASGGDPIYLTGEEVAALEWFSEGFGAKPRIASRFDTEHGDPEYGEDALPIFVHEIGDLHETDGGNYRIKKDESRWGTRLDALPEVDGDWGDV